MKPARIPTAASILLATLIGLPAEAQLGGASVGRGRDNLYSAHWQSHSALTSTDTLRLRYLLLNGGDSAVTVHVRPCGIRVEAAMELETAPMRECDVAPHTLEPGDSVWAQWSGRLVAEPGRYTLAVHYIGAPDESGTLVTGHPVDVTVVPPGPDAPAFTPPGTVSLEPYLLRLAGIVDNPAARRDFEGLFFYIGPRIQRTFVAFEPAAAAARARTRPILVVDLRIAEHPRRRASDWGIRIGAYTTTVGWLSIAPDGTETITCNHGGRSMGGGLPGFGAMLAAEIQTVVERGDRCGR